MHGGAALLSQQRDLAGVVGIVLRESTEWLVACMIGATLFSEAAERIEHAARKGTLSAVQKCVPGFEREHARLVTYLRAQTGAGKATS